jgi:hypothetical protein
LRLICLALRCALAPARRLLAHGPHGFFLSLLLPLLFLLLFFLLLPAWLLPLALPAWLLPLALPPLPPLRHLICSLYCRQQKRLLQSVKAHSRPAQSPAPGLHWHCCIPSSHGFLRCTEVSVCCAYLPLAACHLPQQPCL